MPSLPVPFADIKHTVQVWHDVLSDGWEPRPQMGQPGALGELSIRIGVSRNALQNRLDTAVALGITVRDWRPVEPEFTAGVLRRYRRYDDDFVKAEKAFAPPTQSSAGARPPAAPMTPPGRGKRALAPPRHPGAPPDRAVPVSTIDELISKVIPVLRRGPLTLDELITKLGADASDTSLAIASAIKNGASIDFRGGYWHLDDAPAMGSQHERGDNTPLRLVTDHDGRLRFAAVADTHLCSKYAREDCLNDFYDEVERRGITRVLHAGNWIDGEAPFNRHDLLVHGMDSQMQYLAKNYPCRDNVQTWAITGEDHEGWYSRREGVDVGRYAENVMRQNNRQDWVDVGFMENFIDLTHGNTGMGVKLLLMHPGGGSAYAISYAPQKIVEGFDGGDKPAVLLLGHYHKASYNLIRNVHTVQLGCFQDQTVFMRKMKLSAHLAGCFIELMLDPDTGAVVEFSTNFRNYFVRDYYRNRWSQHGPVNHAPRSA